MNILTRAELKILVEKQSGRCDSVSIFMPTYKTGPEIKQNPARLKNLLVKAEEQLEAILPRAVEARRFLSPIEKLQSDTLFWQHPGNGLAIFLSQDVLRYYFLPLSFEESVVVSHRFQIKPLLPLFSGDGTFYVLALSQNEVKLLRCTHYGVKGIDLAGIIPGSLAEAIRPEGTGRNLQYHSGAPGKGKESVVFHGQGPEKVDENNITRYFQQINKGLCQSLTGENAPLVLAGVNYLHPIYKKVNKYPHLFDKGIDGNPEGLSLDELHRRAWDLVQPYFARTKAEALNEYRTLVGTGHTSSNIEEIVPNAYRGGVKLLFVAPGIRKWGTFDPDSITVKLHEKAESCDEDLMDFAAAYTLIHRGMVYIVKPEDIPDGLPIAAVFHHERHHSEGGE